MSNIYYRLAEQKMEKFDSLVNENKDIERIISRELQKIRLIPLDMFGAKEAINNIIDAEISRKTIKFNRTLPSLMSLNLSNITTRSKFRFDNYYKRFYNSRNRGFDFEGMIAGFLGADISTDKNSPFDIIAQGNKISLKTLKNESESVVIKSIAKNVSNYIKNYRGSEENKNQAIAALTSTNPIKFLVDSGNNDLINIAEDIVNETLSNIDSVLIGIPKPNNKIELFYFTKENIAKLAIKKGVSLNPKSTGSKQLRLSSTILPEADLFGSITFPNLTDEDYNDFLIGDESRNTIINVLNKFGDRYGINDFGAQLPQDIIMDLSKSQNFITDMNFIIGKK
jgi:hypothetical protein